MIHTEACRQYTAKTTKEHGYHYCVAECADHRKEELNRLFESLHKLLRAQANVSTAAQDLQEQLIKWRTECGL